MEQFINNWLVQSILALVSIIEFIVAVVSYLKISKVRKSQIEYHDIVELDNVLYNLSENTQLLTSIRSDQSINLPQEVLDRIDLIVAHNYECIGAVNKANQILLNTNKDSFCGDVIYHERGYFNQRFYKEIILDAKRRVVFFIKRNMRPFTLDNLSSLMELADNKNVDVKIFAFSPEIDETILKEMMKSIPNCPESIDILRSTQINARSLYLEQKKHMRKPQNITYYEYLSYPLSQYIIVDNTLYWGIVNFNKSEMLNVFDERPFLEMDINNQFAQYIVSLQDKLIAECKQNNGVY